MALLFLKKFLIYILTLIKLVEQFLLFKTQNEPENMFMNFFMNDYQLSKDNQNQNNIQLLSIDKDLLDKDIYDMIDQVDIECLQIYIFLSNVFICKKEKKKNISFIYKNFQYEFIYKIDEQERILSCKTKRKDELVKFSFKFIRRQILKDYTIQNKKKHNLNELKYKFYLKYMKSNRKAINYFESFDVSKKGLLILEPYTELIKLIKNFKSKKYIERVIDEYIMLKTDPSITKSISFRNFVEESLSRQHKQSIVIQNIINSLEIFENFFMF